MRRKFLLPALAACAVLAVGAPVANATRAHTTKANPQLTSALKQIKHIQSNVGVLNDLATGFKAAFDTNNGDIAGLKGAVNLISGGVPVITGALTQLGAGLTAAGAGLTAIQAALNNTTTGLVGLNLARPQFGAFAGDGTILGGTGQVTGASGPKTNAVEGSSTTPADNDGDFVVDFGNDVSKRMFTVNVFPLGPTTLGGGGNPPTGSATDCAASVGASGLCGAAQLVASDSSPNHVLVQIGDGKSGGANGFSVTAISG